jgi:hypothetical protein
MNLIIDLTWITWTAVCRVHMGMLKQMNPIIIQDNLMRFSKLMSMRLQRNLHNTLNITQQRVRPYRYESSSQSPRPSSLSWTAVTSCPNYPLTSSAPHSGWQVHNNLPKVLGKSLCEHPHPEFSVTFPEVMGRLSHNVGWHSGDIYSILTTYSVSTCQHGIKRWPTYKLGLKVSGPRGVQEKTQLIHKRKSVFNKC